MGGSALVQHANSKVTASWIAQRRAVRWRRAFENLRLRRPILVLGLPRGGVPVAYEVALALRAPLDVLVVRKIGMPGQPELAIGAVAAGGIIVREPGSVGHLAALDTRFEQLAQRELAELDRRERAYRAGLPPLDLRGQTVVLVDDGLATGATMVAAVRAARAAGAAFVIVAAPVASDEAAAVVGAEADQLAILQVPPLLFAIGAWYRKLRAGRRCGCTPSACARPREGG